MRAKSYPLGAYETGAGVRPGTSAGFGAVGELEAESLPEESELAAAEAVSFACKPVLALDLESLW